MCKEPEESNSDAYDQYVPIFFFSRQVVFHVVADEKTSGGQQKDTHETIFKRMSVVNIYLLKNKKLQCHAQKPPRRKKDP
jgi:hypothetical protein